MKFQGLLLAFVILISILLTTPRGQFSLLQARSRIASQPLTLSNQKGEGIGPVTLAKNYGADKPLEQANVLESSVPLETLTENTQPKISAQVFLKRLLNTNVNLAEQKTKYIWPVASLTKLMTALVAIEKIDLNTEIDRKSVV